MSNEMPKPVPQIREARVKAGYTQDRLAKEMGVSRQTISNLEHGRTFPNLSDLFILAGILGVTWFALYRKKGDGTDDATKGPNSNT